MQAPVASRKSPEISITRKRHYGDFLLNSVAGLAQRQRRLFSSCHVSFCGLCILHLKDWMLRQTKSGTIISMNNSHSFYSLFFKVSLKRMKDRKIGIWKRNFQCSLYGFLQAKLCLLLHSQKAHQIQYVAVVMVYCHVILEWNLFFLICLSPDSTFIIQDTEQCILQEPKWI